MRNAWISWLAVATVACGASATGPGGDGQDPSLWDTADVKLMFVGNSLTYTNDLPSLVGTIAETQGHSVATVEFANPNWSLEEHWNADIASDIRRLEPDVVILQQGPSSLPASREHLVAWTDSLAIAIEDVGALGALLMVWPDRSRSFAFDDVRGSYAAAATSIDGLFIPAGQAWREVWDVDPTLQLWGSDDFHPSVLGSVVAALTVARSVFGTPVADLPLELRSTTGAFGEITFEAELAAIVYPAVDRAVQAWGFGPALTPLP